jgi:hypothetical protein
VTKCMVGKHLEHIEVTVLNDALSVVVLTLALIVCSLCYNINVVHAMVIVESNI